MHKRLNVTLGANTFNVIYVMYSNGHNFCKIRFLNAIEFHELLFMHT